MTTERYINKEKKEREGEGEGEREQSGGRMWQEKLASLRIYYTFFFCTT